MAKPLLNEAERYLLSNWADACRMEESMTEVREKYTELIERVVEAVTEAHPELDAHRVALTQSWTHGFIGIGRESWSVDRNGNPSGLWVYDLRLEHLSSEEYDAPSAPLWVHKKANIDMDAARDLVNSVYRDILTKEELEETETEDSGEHLLWLPAPSKRQLLDAFADGDGQKFVDLFVAQFDMMARFVPVLDRVFRECVVKE